jgi:hypothetical protein
MKIYSGWPNRSMLVILLFFCNLSCNLDKKIQKTLNESGPAVDSLSRGAGRNASAGLSENAKLISQQLIIGLKGFTDTLDPDIRKLMKTIDSIGNLTDAQLLKLGNTLDSVLVRLKMEIKDQTLQAFLNNLLNGLTKNLNKNTRYLLSNMVQATLDSLNSPGSKHKLSILITDALNDSVRLATQKLVTAALQPSVDSIAEKIDKIVHEDIPFIQKQAGKLLWGLGIIAAGIIGYVWYQRRKYARLVQILTYHIDKIPSKDQYDLLTQKIQSQAQDEKLEPLLRTTLKKQGINS